MISEEHALKWTAQFQVSFDRMDEEFQTCMDDVDAHVRKVEFLGACTRTVRAAPKLFTYGMRRVHEFKIDMVSYRLAGTPCAYDRVLDGLRYGRFEQVEENVGVWYVTTRYRMTGIAQTLEEAYFLQLEIKRRGVPGRGPLFGLDAQGDLLSVTWLRPFIGDHRWYTHMYDAYAPQGEEEREEGGAYFPMHSSA